MNKYSKYWEFLHLCTAPSAAHQPPSPSNLCAGKLRTWCSDNARVRLSLSFRGVADPVWLILCGWSCRMWQRAESSPSARLQLTYVGNADVNDQENGNISKIFCESPDTLNQFHYCYVASVSSDVGLKQLTVRNRSNIVTDPGFSVNFPLFPVVFPLCCLSLLCVFLVPLFSCVSLPVLFW